MATETTNDPAGPGFSQGAVLDALPRAIVVTAPDGQILLWNRRATELYGWSPEETIGRSIFDVLVRVEDRDRAKSIADRVRNDMTWEGDFTLLHRKGHPVRAWISNRVVLDGSGTLLAVVSASEDVTEQRLLEQRTADLTEHLLLALEAGGLGTFRWDLPSGTTTWDEKLESLFGLAPGTFGGTFDAWIDLLHPDDVEHVLAVIDAAVQSKDRYTVQHRVIWPDGTVHWLQGAGQVTLDDHGQPTGAIGCTADVTARVLTEQERDLLAAEALAAAEQERISRQRLEFLGAINDVLSESKDRRDVMRKVVRTAVPRMGDWCSIHVLFGDSPIPEVDVGHVDPEMVRTAGALGERFPYDAEAESGIPHVLRTGQPEFYPVITDTVLDELHVPEVGRELIRDFALRSTIIVPLIKRGRVIGGMQFVMTTSGRIYTTDDLVLAQAVAARIASSLDNHRLHEEQRSIAAALQASLLPDELPAIPGVEVAVRYWANGEGIEVGGDFYDVFALNDEDKTWAIVIGDVCGTGPSAAAVTGLARHTIATAAWQDGEPTSVLHTLNRVMNLRRAERFCTAIYGTLTPSDSEITFRFSSAGHPLPMIARSSGDAVASVGTAGSLAGVLDAIELTTTTVQLRPGDLVVLYTDGVTDVPPPHGLTSEEFARLVGSLLPVGSADELAESIHQSLGSILPFEERHDDIALLILRASGTRSP